MAVPRLRFKGFKDEWEEKKFSDVASFSKGVLLSKEQLSQDGTPCILYGELYTKYGEVINDIQSKTKVASQFLTFGKTNDVLIPSSGETSMDIATASCLQTDGVALGGDLNIITPHLDNGIFISYQLNNSKRKNIAQIAQGASVVHLYNESLKKLTLHFPTLSEQQKIAVFLTLLDRKIALQRRKIELLNDYISGISRMFIENFAFSDKNLKINIGQLFAERLERGEENSELLSVTMNYGVCRRSDIESKDNSSDDKSNYKFVHKGDIVYNSMRMWQGANGISPYDGIVSPAYTIIYPKSTSKQFSIEWIGYLFKTVKMINEFRKNSQGLTSDTWNLKYPQISSIKFSLPPIKDQICIVELLKKLDKSLNIHQNQLATLNKYKRFLLQNMFI